MTGGVSPFGGFAGQAWLQTAGASQFNAMAFLVRQIVAGKAFAGLVKVIAVHGGGPSAPSTVDVQPMVNQVDGFGNQVPHGVVYGLPCFRYQGGSAAIIVDPVAGDIGDAVICHRDISAVKATGEVAGPGSFREHDWADGCYFGAFLGGPASVYVMVGTTDVNIVATNLVSVTAPQVNLISSDVRLGTVGGRRVVLDGDPVVGGGGGTVAASSTDVWAT